MARLLGKSKVWGRGYTTIPITVRRLLDIKDGDGLEWYLTEDGKILIKRQERVEGGNQGVSRSFRL